MAKDYSFEIAVNKFLFYQWNFESVLVTYPSIRGGSKAEYMPGCFNAFPPNMIEHLFGKWKDFHREDNHTSFVKLYGELDGTHRYELLHWIDENYKLRDGSGIRLPS